MFSSSGNQQRVTEPKCVSIPAHRGGGRKNRRAGAGATRFHNPNAGQRASRATAVVGDEIKPYPQNPELLPRNRLPLQLQSNAVPLDPKIAILLKVDFNWAFILQWDRNHLERLAAK